MTLAPRGRPATGNRMVSVHLRLPLRDLYRVQALATARYGDNMSLVLRKAIGYGLENIERSIQHEPDAQRPTVD